MSRPPDATTGFPSALVGSRGMRAGLAVLAGMSVVSGFCAPVLADWPQLLGPNRDGKASANAVPLIDTFDGGGPRITWKHRVGEGFAGPVVADGSVFLFHRVDDKATLQALDAGTGEVRWAFAYPTSYRDSFGFDEGPRSAPTVDSGQVFTYGAEGMLHCVEVKSGEARWSVDLAKQFGSAQGFFGRSSAPLVAGERVIVCGGGESNGRRTAVLAFDRNTGEVAWSAVDDEADYASPVLGTFHGKPVVVCFLRSGLALLDPVDGRVLDTERFRAAIQASVNAASPVLLPGDRVFLSSCYDVGAAVWQVTPGLMAESLWQHGDRLDCHYATPVEHGGFLYGFHGRQETGTELRCVRVSDGAVQWKTGRMPAGSVVTAGERLLVLTERGELILAPLSPEAFQPGGRGQVLGAETRALPAISDGFFYARDRRQLVCVDLRAREDAGN